MKFSFSTEVVDLNNQAPNRNKRESKYFWDELYRLIATAGFDSIEVPYEPKWDFGGRSGIPRSNRSITMKYGTVENYMDELRKIGLKEISCFHLDPSLFCGNMMEMYLGAFGHFAEEMIDVAAKAKCETVVVSASGTLYAINQMMKDRPEGIEGLENATIGLIGDLAKKAEERGMKLCVKNEYWGLYRGAKVLDLIEKAEGPVYLDIDIANLKIAGVDPVSFIGENRDRIGIVHFTDTSFVDDQDAYLQALPEFPAKAATKVICDCGEGEVDFAEIKAALIKAGYDGTVVLNCKNSYDIYRSILRAKFVANSL